MSRAPPSVGQGGASKGPTCRGPPCLLPAAGGVPRVEGAGRTGGDWPGITYAPAAGGAAASAPHLPHPPGPARLKGEGKVTGTVGGRRGRLAQHLSIPAPCVVKMRHQGLSTHPGQEEEGKIKTKT